MTASTDAAGAAREEAVLAAAADNAAWCDAVCRSHGIATSHRAGVWAAHRRTPVGYPDAVTTAATATEEDVLRRVDDGPGCSVKDGWASLDLAPAGFAVLLQGQWVHRAASLAVPDAWMRAATAWHVVRTPQELATWTAAHGSVDAIRPALLDDPSVRVVGRAEEGAVRAGAVLTTTTAATGVSNVFGAGPAPEEVWWSVTALAHRLRPGAPLVGWEADADLPPAVAAGFVPVGPLRVWLKN